MREFLKCSTCMEYKAKLVKTKSGNVIICDTCMYLGARASEEVRVYGDALDTTRPETFRQKPAKSKLWLILYFQVNTKYTLH